MPHKDKKTHCEYMKRYLKNPINSAKNREIQKKRYWKNRIMDYCDMNKISYQEPELQKMTGEQLKGKFKEIEEANEILEDIHRTEIKEKQAGIKA